MDPTVKAALIAAAASIIVNLISGWRQGRKREKDAAVKEANLESRLKNIEDKLDTHNSYADKLGAMALDLAVIKTEIKNLYSFSKT